MARRRFIVSFAVILFLLLVAAAVVVLGRKYNASLALALHGGVHLLYRMAPLEVDGQQESVAVNPELMNRTVRIIEARMRELNVLARVQPVAGSSTDIAVDLASNFDDLTLVKGALHVRGLFEIVELKGGPFKDHDAAIASVGGMLSPDLRLVSQLPSISPTQLYVSSSKAIVTNDDLLEVDSSSGDAREARITLSLEGQRRLEAFAKEGPGRQVAIMVDSMVFSAPFVQLPIGNPAVISTSDREQASALIMLCRFAASGALPVRLVLLEQNILQPAIKISQFVP